MTALTTQTAAENQVVTHMVSRVWYFLLFCYDRKIRDRLRLELPGGPMELPVEFSSIFRIRTYLDTLIGQILPLIRRRIEFEETEVRTTTASGALKGQILWEETLGSWHHLPREYTYVDPVKIFTTPENILTVVTLLQVRDECSRTLERLEDSQRDGNPLAHQVFEELGKGLRRAASLIELALGTTHLAEAVTDARRILRNEAAIRRLERAVQLSVSTRGKINVGYRELLKWRDEFFRALSIIEGIRGSAIRFVNIADYKLYEIYALIELLTALHATLRPRELTLNSGDATASFRQPSDETTPIQTVLVFYNRVPKGPESWIKHAIGEGLVDGAIDAKQLAGLPDVFIEVHRTPGPKQYVVADFKFSTRPTYITDSRFKTLGYMYEFDIPKGMLIFGGEHSLEPDQGAERDEEEVKASRTLAEELHGKRGLYLHNVPRQRQLAVVLVDPRPESEAKNHRALCRALEALLSG